MSETDRKSIDALVFRVDEDRWLSSRYAPAPERADLIALYGLNYELARIRLAVSEPALGAIRFQWWREALDAMSDPAKAGRHIVTRVLTETMERGEIDVSDLQDLVNGHQDAFEAGDRSLEPEAALAALAVRLFGPVADTLAASIVEVAQEFAAARRGETPAKDAVAPIRVEQAFRPALAHLALRHAYRTQPAPGPLAKRWRVLRSVVTGLV